MIEWVNLNKVLIDYGNEVVKEYRNNLQLNNHTTNQNDLINKIEVIINKDDTSISVNLELMEYYKFIEWDTKPHFPPLTAISNWIKIKPIIPTERNGNLPTEKQLAYLIGRAMAGKSPNQANLKNPQGGTKGTFDLSSAIKTINQKYVSLIEEAIAKDVDAGITIILTEFFNSSRRT